MVKLCKGLERALYLGQLTTQFEKNGWNKVEYENETTKTLTLEND
jgi:hypothetical protein